VRAARCGGLGVALQLAAPWARRLHKLVAGSCLGAAAISFRSFFERGIMLGWFRALMPKEESVHRETALGIGEQLFSSVGAEGRF
jgi:hypothetical protein